MYIRIHRVQLHHTWSQTTVKDFNWLNNNVCILHRYNTIVSYQHIALKMK